MLTEGNVHASIRSVSAKTNEGCSEVQSQKYCLTEQGCWTVNGHHQMTWEILEKVSGGIFIYKLLLNGDMGNTGNRKYGKALGSYWLIQVMEPK